MQYTGARRESLGGKKCLETARGTDIFEIMKSDTKAVMNVSSMTIKVILEPSDEGGFTVIVPALPGCISEGDSKEEALNNIREAIELYIEPLSA